MIRLAILVAAFVHLTSTQPASDNTQNDDLSLGAQATSATLTPTHVIPKGSGVHAVTSLGDDVFVTRYNVQEVEVYNAETLTLRRRLPVPDLGLWPSGIAACAVRRCVYVSDWLGSCVHRVELTGDMTVTKWFVASRPAGLTMVGAHNVLVTCNWGNTLQEYSAAGFLQREVVLQNITKPWHAAQLPSGQFVVSHDHPVGNVSLVREDGRSEGSTQGPLDNAGTNWPSWPRSLAVDRNGCVLVADWDNNRILALNPSLTSSHVLPLAVDGGLQGPFGLHLDESRDRLYVGELSGGRLLVFDNVKLVPGNCNALL